MVHLLQESKLFGVGIEKDIYIYPLSDKSTNLTPEVFIWLVPSFLTLLLAFPSPVPSFQNSPIQLH